MTDTMPEESAIDVEQILDILKSLLPENDVTLERAQLAFSTALHSYGVTTPFDSFKMTVRADQTPVIALNENNRIIFANAGAYRLFECSQDELDGSSIVEWMPKAESAELLDRITHYRQRHLGKSRPDDEVRTTITLQVESHEVHTQYAMVPAGENLGIVFTDYGERETLRAAVNYLPCGVSVIDKNLQVIAWNEEVLRLQDYSRYLFENRLPSYEEVVRDICERGDYGKIDTEKKVAEMVALAKQFQPHHVIRERSDGTVLENRGAPIPGGGFVTTYTDITEKHRQDQQIKQLVTELEQANQAKTTFLASASHDLRQPLQAITLFSSALSDILSKDGVADIDKARDVAKSLENSVNNLGDLLNSILDIAKLEAGIIVPKTTSFSIGELLLSLTEQHRAKAEEKGLNLNCVASESIVQTDRALLGRAIGNLIANAVRYTETGRILVGCRRKSKALSVQVWDTGPGFSEDKSEDIFLDFVQLDATNREHEHGMGLGLAIVKRTCDLLGLSISTRSSIGEGSVFCVEIPLAEANTRSIESDDINDADLAFTYKPIILVIEDNPAVLAGTGLLLDQWGFQSILSGTLNDGLRQIQVTGKKPNLVLADYRLANDQNGIDAIEGICRETKQALPGIIITADTGSNSLRHISESGYALLHKPLDPSKLRQLVTTLLADA